MTPIVSEDVQLTLLQRRRQRRRFLFWVLSPVVLFWMAFGYQFWKVKPHEVLGRMQFFPRARTALSKMMPSKELEAKLAFNPVALDYGDWVPLAEARLDPSVVRDAPNNTWHRFHEPEKPRDSIYLPPTRTLKINPNGTDYEFYSTVAYGEEKYLESTEVANGAYFLPIGPNGVITIPEAGAFSVEGIQISLPDTVAGPQLLRHVDHRGTPKSSAPATSLKRSQHKSHAEISISLNSGTSKLDRNPFLCFFDAATHSVFQQAIEQKTEDKLWYPQCRNEPINARQRILFSHPVNLRLGVKVWACQGSGLEIPLQEGASQRDSHLEVKVLRILVGDYGGNASGGAHYSALDLTPKSDFQATTATTVVLMVPDGVQLDVVGITPEGKELPSDDQDCNPGVFRRVNFIVPPSQLASLRIHRMVQARFYVDLGLVDPNPGGNDPHNALNDRLHQYEVRTWLEKGEISSAMNRTHGMNSHEGIPELFPSGGPRKTIKFTDKTIREILQTIESDPDYLGEKIQIEQNHGWIWTGRTP